jgi:hypothetical protein
MMLSKKAGENLYPARGVYSENICLVQARQYADLKEKFRKSKEPIKVTIRVFGTYLHACDAVAKGNADVVWRGHFRDFELQQDLTILGVASNTGPTKK